MVKRIWKDGLLNGFKRYVGFASTGGIVAFFAVPGPHTLVVVGGLAVGAVVARITRRKP